MLPSYIPIATLLDGDPQDRLAGAAIDLATERPTVVHGDELLKQIAATGQASQLSALRVGVRPGSGEMEKLLALVQAGREQPPDATPAPVAGGAATICRTVTLVSHKL